MAAGGDAIARLADGRVVFVTGMVPGELADIDVHTSKRDFAKATVERIIEPSPDRVTAPCPERARGCGGCAWQHIDPAAQLRWKVAIVTEALRRTAKLTDPSVVAGGAVGPWAYRTSMRLAVAPDGRVGLREAASHRVVPLGSCMVAHPSLSALLAPTRVRGADELSLRVSAATGEASALTSDPRARLSGLPAEVAVGPDAVIHEQVAGVSLRVSAPSFFQSGPDAAAMLVDAVRAACGDHLRVDEPVLDAYGGVGLFAAALGLDRAILVESSRSACVDAGVNLAGAEIHAVAFERWTPEHVRLAIVDPARTGLGRASVDVLAATHAERVVLVSCDPVSLARDTTLLAVHGYEHRSSTVLDLFPHTPHIEVVTVFDRRAASSEPAE